MALIVPQGALSDRLSHRRDRVSRPKLGARQHLLPSCSLLASSTHSVRRQHGSSAGCLRCAAVTGGSKRDVEKLVARTQHRRPRHKKGMTPSKADLLEELEEEEETEVDVENEVSQLVSKDGTPKLPENGSEYLNNGGSVVEGGHKSDAKTEENSLQGHDDQDSEDLSSLNVINNSAEGVQGICDATEDATMDVINRAAGTQKQVVNDAVKRGESLAGGIRDVVSEQAHSSSSDLDEVRSDETGDLARAVDDLTSGTASNVDIKMNETGQLVQEDIADVAMDPTSYANNKVSDSLTVEQSGRDLSEVVLTSQRFMQSSSNAIIGQAKDFTLQAEKVLQAQGSVLEQGAMKVQREANESLGRVQDSVQKAVEESGRAARNVRLETLGMGELLMDTARDTIQDASATIQNRGMRTGTRTLDKEAGSFTEDVNPKVSQQKETSPFNGLKVLVAGASGQTGRLIVENLVAKGGTVRAMVRDLYNARSMSQLRDCEFVEADLYNYEAVRKAIGDCNAVICAIGARAFPFDLLNTYQVEYEGVLNLISAAKNQGKVKKFILISTIGVTYLQLVPLIFWKKQAELCLQRSGLDYTIVRPGGLRNTNEPEQIVMQGADSQFFGGISRKKVAEVCTSALISSDASHKIVEVVSVPGPQRRSIGDLFKQV